ncbi:MAG TPA: hypothetical protein VGR78_00725 [Verrucomicrobiae bacterium]|jgi:hypothetical protein|nr:hypothetical protein [Verrucomicrobiae bacterium]
MRSWDEVRITTGTDFVRSELAQNLQRIEIADIQGEQQPGFGGKRLRLKGARPEKKILDLDPSRKTWTRLPRLAFFQDVQNVSDVPRIILHQQNLNSPAVRSSVFHSGRGNLVRVERTAQIGKFLTGPAFTNKIVSMV